MLNDAIDKSGLSLREVSRRCSDFGVNVTHSYISQLKSGKQSSPSSEITEAIASALDIDPNLLLIEKYLEDAPLVLRKYLENNYLSRISNLDEVKINAGDKYLEFLYAHESLGTFILNEVKIPTKQERDNYYHEVFTSDSLEPLIPSGSLVNLSDIDQNGSSFSVSAARANYYTDQLVMIESTDFSQKYLGYLRNDIYSFSMNDTGEKPLELFLVPFSLNRDFKPIVRMILDKDDLASEKIGHINDNYMLCGFVKGFEFSGQN